MCVDLGDSEAWGEFLRRFYPVIMSAVRRTGRRYAQFRPDLRHDLVQEVFLKLAADRARALRQFVSQGPGSAFGYVKVIAVRVVHDCLKSKGFQRIPDSMAEPPDIPAPDRTDWLQLVREIDDCLRLHASERDRRIFWLYYRQGMAAPEIAAIPAMVLTIKGVQSVIVRLNLLVRENLALGKRE